jgi:serine/threonine protein kinase
LLQEPGGIEKLPLKTRLELIARLAMAPGHISPRPSGASGSSGKGTAESEMSSSADPGGPEVLLQNILNTGSDEPFYTAPELLDGGSSPSPRSEVYALGVLLYQVVVGDLSRPLEADWKEAVTDDILREDIAACVETLPEKRRPHPWS